MLWLENVSSLHAVITAKYCYFCEILLWPSKKTLVWQWCCLCQCSKSEGNQLLFIYLLSSMEWLQGVKRGRLLGYGYKILMQVVVYFGQKMNEIYIVTPQRSCSTPL